MFSGFGSIPRYDNVFGPCNFNAEDIDDFLAMQRDWGVDGGLRTVPPDEIGELRRYAAQACRRCTSTSGWPTSRRPPGASGGRGRVEGPGGDRHAGRAERGARDPRGGLTVVDIVAALDETGYEAEAEAILDMTRARLSGDYLQTAAIFDEQLQVLSLVTDPNDYAGPGTGYEPSPPRQAEIDEIRQARGSTTCAPSRPRPPSSCSPRSARPSPGRIRGTWSSACPPRWAGTCGAPCPG